MVALCGLLACSGCLSAGPGGEGAALGSFTLVSTRLGNHTIVPATCTAGDRQVFLGGDFADPSSGMVIRLVVDPLAGPAARVFVAAEPYEKSVVFQRSQCRTFQLSLETTGWRINHVRDYRIAIDLDCANDAGDAIAGKASATHCH